MGRLQAQLLGGAEAFVTSRADGDVKLSPSFFLRDIADTPWRFVRQVHGSDVIVLSGDDEELHEGDAIVTSSPDIVIGVLGADCGLIGLSSREGVVAVVHAGWRGLAAGVVQEAVRVMRDQGARTIEAVLGPCIHVECYEFSPDDLDQIVASLGDNVAGKTVDGRAALDLPRGIRLALDHADVNFVGEIGGCTACSDRYFSYRARKEDRRHALGVRGGPR